MPQKRILPFVMIVLLSFLFALAGCGDDDPADEGNGGTPVAPVVVEIDPGEGDTGVSTTAQVRIEFSKAMDQSTAAGNVTLSSGTITDLTWDDVDELVVSHSEWAEATNVTVTVGTGLTDTEGNALPQAWTSSFWTMSSQVVFLESDPANDATDVSRSVSPMLLFSHMMDLPSLESAITITEPTPAAVVPAWSVEYVENNWYRINFEDPLTATTMYNINVATTAYAQGNPGMTLSAEVDIAFTTGSEVDTEPPYIASVSPAVGSTVNPDLTTIVVTFNEPIDGREDISPSRVGAHIMAYMPGEPTWNQDFTQLTLYVVPPLPTGVRFFAVFDQGAFYDMAGNANAEADSISFTVAGNADYYPVHSNWDYHYLYLGDGKQGENEVRVTFDTIAGDTFEKVEWWYNFFLEQWEEENRDRYRKNGDALWFRGFYEEDVPGYIMFDPEIKWQELPFAVGEWSGHSTMAFGPTMASIDYSGATVGQETLVLDTFKQSDPALVFEDCWLANLAWQVTAGEDLINEGEEAVWYCPGIGVIQQHTRETDYEELEPVTREYSIFLMELIIDQ